MSNYVVDHCNMGDILSVNVEGAENEEDAIRLAELKIRKAKIEDRYIHPKPTVWLLESLSKVVRWSLNEKWGLNDSYVDGVCFIPDPGPRLWW